MLNSAGVIVAVFIVAVLCHKSCKLPTHSAQTVNFMLPHRKKLVVVKLGLSERHGMGLSLPIH